VLATYSCVPFELEMTGGMIAEVNGSISEASTMPTLNLASGSYGVQQQWSYPTSSGLDEAAGEKEAYNFLDGVSGAKEPTDPRELILPSGPELGRTQSSNYEVHGPLVRVVG